MYKQDIKINSDLIWNLLSDVNALSIEEIEELTGYNEKFIYMALGWLLKENKILLTEKHGTLYVESLKSNYSEMYF
ncbi:winged helix-turn-helix domain-containing protein [Draconibacterium sp.]|jgi:3-methyladenine DNA glycosylase AlkD|uniref:winged helix-turn-helix domain-containing protein n=1 Tax=Draconibacterium sp. TaxID=1965318 RepID=UPI0035652B24